MRMSHYVNPVKEKTNMKENKIIKIKEPFWTAATKYKWPVKSPGVGIAHNEFAGDGELKITVGNDPRTYSIDKKKAIEFIKQYQSIYWAKGKLKLGVLPLSMFCKTEPNGKLDL
jgi:hypothetical protein